MDHARHLSSPSPTSPFLFHHSERSFKTHPLTPLLSSTADVTSVDDYLSNTSSNISHQNHNPFGVDHHHQHHPLVDNHHHHHHHHHHHQQNHQRNHSDQCVIDQDSLTGVDDDDGMHNMLSGSSTSSTSTMPLLTESHSHHSFSRISLEEYSPLSLVEDCDNALPISPTSLACGSHHSFKSSLNGLKMDNLVGDVGVHDHEVHDDVNDARSLSPSLLSTSTSNHHNLWSTSSTAITQNTSLLSSTSTSFLLSQHHHQQLNSLIQQLEPQSLDEAPPLVSNSSTFETSPVATNRPSSEPPPGSELEHADIESKSLICQPLQSNTKQPNPKQQATKANATKVSVSLSTQPSKTRKSRSRSSTSKQVNQSNNDNKKVLEYEEKQTSTSNELVKTAVSTQQVAHSSKVHLQLNHHKKLQELQQRLFGTTNQTGSNNDGSQNDEVKEKNLADTSAKLADTKLAVATTTNATSALKVKEEPDSSAFSKNQDGGLSNQNESTKTKARQQKNRRGRNTKNEVHNASSSTSSSFKSTQKTVTETVEPDTTTKNSECVRLADLLSNPSSAETKSSSIFEAGSLAQNGPKAADTDLPERRLQQVQVQVAPSPTLVLNGGLIQPVDMQQQQLQQQQPQQLPQSQQQPAQQQQLPSHTNGTVIATANQILCRPQTVIATAGGQIKGLMSGSDLLKGGEALANWSLQTNGGNGNGTAATLANNQTIGTHQIAIQVICQDGTSLVLPVSSAAGLNAAVSLTSQHQQLQAVLASNANPQRQSNQLLPLMSVSNIVAQQQLNNENGGSSFNSPTQTSSNQTSGLAASSPTLAALLDAGSARNSNDLNNGNLSGQNFVSTNLLRKLVSGNPTELKRGDLTLQQGSTLSLSNCGGLVTVCAPNVASNSSVQTLNKNVNFNGSNSSEKRVKLDHSDSTNNTNQTFTLIDPQNIIVTNGSNEKGCKQPVQASTSTSTNTSQQHTTKSVNTETTKQSKMGSSTGNRQVDPTQPFRCEHCNSTFTRLGNFTRHKKIHTVPTKDGQRFKCDVCSKSFLQRCDLARHLHIHRGTEPHRCDICGKGYIRHSDLVTHQRFHNKEKPFGCPHCSKGFCQRGDLNRHLRSIHLQMKPILCPCCNRKFAKQETLLRHLNTAHRSKTGTTTANAVIAELPPNYTLTQGDEKQTTISVVTNAAILNNNIAQKNAPVASLQAIKATLCKVSQSVDPSTTSGQKAVSPNGQVTTVKAIT